MMRNFAKGVSISNGQSARDRHLDMAGMLILICLCASWGLNQAVIKWAYQGVSPILSSAIRSLVAAFCLAAYCRVRGIALISPGMPWLHVAGISFLFTLEFVVLYVGMDYTLASRGAVLLYTQPMFTAALAHLAIAADRLNFKRSLGLGLAFLGVGMVILERGGLGRAALGGDLLCVAAGFLWAVCNVWVRLYLVDRLTFHQILYWQLFISGPLLLGASFLFEEPWINPTANVVLALGYQSVAVAFVSYLIWFSLFSRYRVSDLGAFTFLAPVFGVIFARFITDDPLTGGLLVGLAGVSVGVWMVNKH